MTEAEIFRDAGMFLSFIHVPRLPSDSDRRSNEMDGFNDFSGFEHRLSVKVIFRYFNGEMVSWEKKTYTKRSEASTMFP